MKKLFLTGGTGFFGKSILDSGLFKDTELTILSRDPERFRRNFPCGQNIRFIQGDIRNFQFPEERFDWIIHGATTASPAISDEETTSVIIDGTKHILEFSRVCGAERLLYVSSGAVYGPQEPELYGIPEDHPLNPVTVYGKAKLAAERLCLDSGTDTVISRGFAFIGKYLPRENTHFAAGNFLSDVIHDRPVIIKGDGRDFRSYLDADDLVSALKALLLYGHSGEAYNTGSSKAVSIRDLAETIVKISGKNLPVRILSKPGSKNPSRYVPDTGKISVFFQEKITLENAVAEILHGSGAAS